MLRSIVAAYVGASPSELEFDAGPFGKPSLRGEASSLEFNMSHSGDMVVIAIARDRAVGVDVEQWSSTVEIESIAEMVFSSAEREYVIGTDAGGRHPAFFRVWSRKEAYIKATGDGVSQGLDHFDVITDDDPERIVDRFVPEAADRWSLRDLNLGAGYAGAIAAAGHGWDLRTYFWDPARS